MVGPRIYMVLITISISTNSSIIRNIYSCSDKKSKTIKQKILGLNKDGTLLVENMNGITESISSGEIAFINN